MQQWYRKIKQKAGGKGYSKGVFRYFTFKILIVSFLFLGSLFLFAVMVHEAVYENELAFDNKVFSYFAAISTVRFIDIMESVTFFGSAGFLLPAYCIIISYFLFKKKYRYSLHILIVSLTSTGLMFWLKEVFHRHRPQLPVIAGITNYSFPSGHSLSIFIFCGIFTYIIWHTRLSTGFKWLYSVLLFCFAVTIGISRIVLRVHYPTDVIASFCLGTVWAIISLWVLRKISKKEKAKEGARRA